MQGTITPYWVAVAIMSLAGQYCRLRPSEGPPSALPERPARSGRSCHIRGPRRLVTDLPEPLADRFDLLVR